jgi:hypothetical protein
MAGPIGSDSGTGPVWPNWPPDITVPVTSDPKSVPLTDMNAPKTNPFGMSPSDEAALTQYGARVITVDNLKGQAKAAGLNSAEADALGDYLFSLPQADFNRETSLVRNALKSDNPP